MKFFQKAVSLCVAGTLGLALLSSCSAKTEPSPAPTVAPTEAATPAPTEEVKPTETPTDAAPIVYRRSGSTVATLSPHQYVEDSARLVLVDTTGSLYSIVYDQPTDNLKFTSIMAADFPTSTDNKVWTIKLKDDLKFTNGKPITAETFEYSWKMLLDPALASPQSGNMYDSLPIKNAEAYFLRLSEADYDAKKADATTVWSEVKPSENPVKWEDVGIKAIDKNTLQITLSSEFNQTEVTYNFSTSGAKAPVDPEMYEACMNADRTENTYGTTLETLAQSGPYTLVAWVKDQYRVYERNNDWPGGKIYTPDVIEEKEITDANAAVQLFENGDLDVIVPTGANATKYLEDPRALKVEGPVVWGFYINTQSKTNPILNDNDFRKAIFYGMDRTTIARDIYKVYIPADYFVSRRAIVGNILSGAQRYRDTPEGKANENPNFGFDTAKAVEFFNKAYAANGNKKVSVSLTYFDNSDSQKKTAEFLKEAYEKQFGTDKFTLELKAMPSTPAYDTYFNRTFDMGFGTMGQDSFNPWSSLNVWSSASGEKADTFYNAEFDTLQKRSATGDLVANPEERTKALGRMEQLLLDYLPWIPIYQNDGIVLYNDRITVKPTKYITGIAYAPMQADMTNDVPRSITVK